jgi:hypothetical protein
LGGKPGVSYPDDLEVRPTSPTSAGIDVTFGQCAVLNAEPNRPNEMYMVLFDDPEDVTDIPVPANATGSTQYYLVVVTVLDPEMELTGDPATYTDEEMLTRDFGEIQVIHLNPLSPTVGAANVTKVEQLGLDISAFAIARIRLLAGAGSVQSADITDLRLPTRTSRSSLAPRGPRSRMLARGQT